MLAIRIKCPKHPRFSPQADGQQGIKGGCVMCAEIYRLYLHAAELQRKLWRDVHTETEREIA